MKKHYKLELVYLPKGKYCAYPRMVYRLAIVMPPPPFWMTENEFQILCISPNGLQAGHCDAPSPILDDRKWISPFQINTQLWVFFTKWLPAAILDATFIFLDIVRKMAAGGHFGWPKITFDRISRYFRSIRNFFCLHKMAASGHFGWPKITFDRISRYFRSIRNFFCLHKMAASGHFGWPKITFDRISRHFRSMHNFFLIVFKMAASGHFGSPICAKNNRVLPLCVINGYAKYEVDRGIYDTVRDTTSFLSIFIQNGRQRRLLRLLCLK